MSGLSWRGSYTAVNVNIGLARGMITSDSTQHSYTNESECLLHLMLVVAELLVLPTNMFHLHI